MLKIEIRKEALRERLMISDIDYQNLNNLLLYQFATLDFSQIKVLHLFLPIIEKREPNTFLFIDWITKKHPQIKIIVPKANFELSTMTHHEYSGKESLVKSEYNILEPISENSYNGTVDLVLVPLLAFDKRGYRVGYGKGFYDRFLQTINAQKIGLSLQPAIEKIDDVNEHDIRLDLCITPTEIIKF